MSSEIIDVAAEPVESVGTPSTMPMMHASLRPGEIQITDDFDVRPYFTKNKLDQLKANRRTIVELAENMRKEGQHTPIWVYAKWDGDAFMGYFAISGHRRREAALYIEETHKTEFLLLALIETDLDRAKAIAITENFYRLDPTSMDRAYLVQRLDGLLVGEFPKKFNRQTEIGRRLNIDVSTVRLMYAVVELPPTLQRKIAEGELAYSTALELVAKTKSGSEEKVLEKAQVLEKKKAQEIIKSVQDKAGERPLNKQEQAVVAREQEKIEKGKVGSESVRGAIRETENERTATPANKKELLAELEYFANDTTLNFDSGPREFFRYFVENFALNATTSRQRTLRKKWDNIFEKGNKGSGPKEETKEE